LYEQEPIMGLRFLAGVLALSVAATVPARADQGESVSKFYAYCVEVGIPGVVPRPLAEQARMLRELGYDGIGIALNAQAESNLKILDDAGLKLYMVWTSVNVNPAKGAAYGPQLPGAIRKLKGRPVTVCLLLGGLKAGDPQGMETAVKALRELGDVAAEAGVRISIYNHVGNWTESLPFVIGVIRKTNHPQVGFNFNLCHWLKVNGAQDYRPFLRENADKLFVVTLNGATMGAQTWAGLIRPLDEGDFGQAEFLATLREIGYRGPVGLMCFGVAGDARLHLGRSMKVWRDLHRAAPSGR
jgi:sugar phosphate isomerase/epimerase